MASDITFFPVGNGDMTLIRLPGPEQFTILVDCYFIEDTSDTVSNTSIDDVYKYLPIDANGRPYVDVYMLSHPDDDHCHGAKDTLHLGPVDDYVDNPKKGNRKKIFVRELWSAPMVFRRKGKDESLTPDAQQIKKEAKRRVDVFRKTNVDSSSTLPDGNRVLILGQDQKKDGQDRLAGLEAIHIDIDEAFTVADGGETRMEAHVRGPLPPCSSEEEEEVLKSNRSSIILQLDVYVSGKPLNTVLLSGDAEVGVWQRLYSRYKNNLDALSYDLLLAPHHCSWGVLSEEESSNTAKPDPDALQALSQTDSGYIVASSKAIKDNDDNPPSYRARGEYIGILNDDDTRFFCTGEWPDEDDPEPLTFEFTSQGPKAPSSRPRGRTAKAMAVGLSNTEREHG